MRASIRHLGDSRIPAACDSAGHCCVAQTSSRPFMAAMRPRHRFVGCTQAAHPTRRRLAASPCRSWPAPRRLRPCTSTSVIVHSSASAPGMRAWVAAFAQHEGRSPAAVRRRRSTASGAAAGQRVWPAQARPGPGRCTGPTSGPGLRDRRITQGPQPDPSPARMAWTVARTRGLGSGAVKVARVGRHAAAARPAAGPESAGGPAAEHSRPADKDLPTQPSEASGS